MSNKKLILFNAGKHAGKTAAVDYLQTIYELTRRQTKDRLHEMTMMFFNVDSEVYWVIYLDSVAKELPNHNFTLTGEAYNKLMDFLYNDPLHHSKNDFEIISLRNAMIYVSEIVVKPAFGKEYFGKYRVDQIQENEIAVDDSTGFEYELYPAIRELGQENILLIRINGRGETTDDSRELISDGVINNTIDIQNDSSVSLEGFLVSVEQVVTAFLNGDVGLTNNQVNQQLTA
jgi:hypothetical protein